MATEGRRPLHQRSNSQINSAGIKQTENVSSLLASTPSLFHNSSKLLQQFESLDTLGQTKQNDENALSRRTSIASKATANSKTSRSSKSGSSGEKRINLVTVPVSKAAASRSSSIKSDRIPSGPPPYSGPPQGTSTIRFVPHSPAGTPPHPSSSTTRRPASKKRSASTLSSNNSELDENLPSFDFAFPPTVSIPLPAYDYSASENSKESVSKTRKHSLPASITSSTSSAVNNTLFHTQDSPVEPVPPLPSTFESQANSQPAVLRSTIRYVAPTPPGGTPVSRRARSRSNPRTVSTRSRSSTNTSNHSSISRRRSHSSDFQQRRQRRPSLPSSSRVPSRHTHSSSSYGSSVSAIGFPPSRPLPTPPDRPGTSASQAVSDPPASPVALPKFPKPILKKARTSPDLNPIDADATPPIDAEQYPEIRPALSWILETAPADFAPAPLNINKPKRARMQVLADEETTRTNSHGTSTGRDSHSHGSESVGLNGSERSAGSAVAATPSVSVRSVRGHNPHYWQAEGAQSERATLFSVGDAHLELRRGSTNPAYFTSAAVPEWARIYYGHGRPLPRHQEEDATSEDDDLRITPVHQPRRPPQVHIAQLQRVDTIVSRSATVWMGTRNPEGRDLQDQFTQPRLENTPINRSERINRQLILFCIGFVFPITWIIAAFLPLSKRKRWERRERLEMQEIVQATRVQSQGLGISHSMTGPTANIIHTDVSTDTESLPSITTLEETRRYDNERWWRNVNRIMVVIGIVLAGGIIALLVVGLKHKS